MTLIIGFLGIILIFLFFYVFERIFNHFTNDIDDDDVGESIGYGFASSVSITAILFVCFLVGVFIENFILKWR
jgi:hypothetical protein